MARFAYRRGIQRTYQVFPDPKKKAPVTQPASVSEAVFGASQNLDLTGPGVSPVSFPVLSDFAQRAGLPSFVFNTTVRPPLPKEDVPLSHRIFELGPVGFGSESCGYVAWEEIEGFGWEPGKPVEKNWMFRNDAATHASPYATLRNFNVAPAISGAAFSGTNMPEAQRKLRWLFRLLNMGLEYVVPDPSNRRPVLRLSDGGHSENLGAYALLRRRCRTILIVDAGEDPSYTFDDYRTLKEAAEAENGLRMKISIPGLDKIRAQTAAFDAGMPIHEGTATMGDQYEGKIFYVKLSMHPGLLGDQANTIKAYAERCPKFPQEPTTDQYFEPEQFEAYRALGYAIARTLPPDVAS